LKSLLRSACRSRPWVRSPLPRWLERSTLAVAHFREAPTSDEGPTAASMTNYLTPVVAVLLGIAFVDERLSWNLIIGTAMILAGLWTAEHHPDEPRPASDTLMLSENDAQGRAPSRWG
jgi:EamA-like transporter family